MASSAETGTDRTFLAFCCWKLTLTAAWSRPLTCRVLRSVMVIGTVADGALDEPPEPELEPDDELLLLSVPPD